MAFYLRKTLRFLSPLTLSHCHHNHVFSDQSQINPSIEQSTHMGKKPIIITLSKTTNPQKTQKIKPQKRRGDRKSAHTIQQDPLLAILKTPASALS
jgi:hypothetical protein